MLGLLAAAAVAGGHAGPAGAIDAGEHVAYACGGTFGDPLGQICAMRPDGSGRGFVVTRATFPPRARPVGLTTPAWAPDSGTLAFLAHFEVADGRVESQVHLIGADGRGLRAVGPRIRGPRGLPTGMEWSPDGRRIALSRGAFAHPRSPVLVLDLVTRALVKVAAGRYAHWRPGTSQLSYHRPGPADPAAVRPELRRRFPEWVWTVDLATGARRPIRPARSHAWTPSGLLVTAAYDAADPILGPTVVTGEPGSDGLTVGPAEDADRTSIPADVAGRLGGLLPLTAVRADGAALVFAAPSVHLRDGTCVGPLLSLAGVDLDAFCIDADDRPPRVPAWRSTLARTQASAPAPRPCGAGCGPLATHAPGRACSAASPSSTCPPKRP